MHQRVQWSSVNNKCKDMLSQSLISSASSKGFSINYLGIQASAIHCRSILQARSGIWGYGTRDGGSNSFPFVIKTSITSWSAESHSHGSCINTTASMAGKSLSIVFVCQIKRHVLRKLIAGHQNKIESIPSCPAFVDLLRLRPERRCGCPQRCKRWWNPAV